MLQPETQPRLVIQSDWPMVSGLLLTGVTLTAVLAAGLKSAATLPVNEIGAAFRTGEASPERTSNAALHGNRRRSTMTSLLPRMVSSSRGSRPWHDTSIVIRDDLARKSVDQRSRATSTPRLGRDDGSIRTHLRAGSKDPGSATLVRGRLPSVSLPRG